MPTFRPRIRRTATPNAAPVGLLEGELSVEMASNPLRLWVGVPSSIDGTGRRLVNSAEGSLGNYLPLTGGTISGDLAVNGATYLNTSMVQTGALTVANAMVASTTGGVEVHQGLSVVSGNANVLGHVIGEQLRFRESDGTNWAWYSSSPGNAHLWRGTNLYSFNSAGDFSVAGHFSANSIGANYIASAGSISAATDVVAGAALYFVNQHGGHHAFVGAADGWAQGPAHLRVGNFIATGNSTVDGSLFVGGIQVYNDGAGRLYSATYRAVNFEADSGVAVGGLWLTNQGGWLQGHDHFRSGNIHAWSELTTAGNLSVSGNAGIAGVAWIGGVQINNDGSGKLWCGEYNCTNIFAGNLHLGGVHCFNHGGWFYAANVRADALRAENNIYSVGTIVAGGAVTAAGFASLIDMDCGNNLQVVNSVNIIVGGFVIQAGNAWKPGGGEFLPYSDRRLKASEVPYERGLAAICGLHPVTYQYNGRAGMPTDRDFIGVTADDVIEVMPEMIGSKTADDGEDYMTADGSAVKWALVNAVQELATQVDRLGQRLDTLERDRHG